MHVLTDKQLAEALLSVALAMPADLPLNILAVHGMPLVILWDCREEADAAILEAVAQNFGPIVATSMDHFDQYKRQAVAAMIRTPPGRDPEHVAGELRVAYTIATAADDAGDEPDPF